MMIIPIAPIIIMNGNHIGVNISHQLQETTPHNFKIDNITISNVITERVNSILQSLMLNLNIIIKKIQFFGII